MSELALLRVNLFPQTTKHSTINYGKGSKVLLTCTDLFLLAVFTDIFLSLLAHNTNHQVTDQVGFFLTPVTFQT